MEEIYTILTQFKNIPAGEMPAIKTHVNTQNNRFRFTLSSEDIILKIEKAQDRDALALFSSAKMLYTCSGEGFVVPVTVTRKEETNAVVLDCESEIPKLEQYTKITRRAAWMMYLVLELEDGYHFYRFKEIGENAKPIQKGDIFFDRSNQFEEPIESFVVEDTDMVTMIGLSRYGNYSLIAVKKENRFTDQFVTSLKEMRIQKNRLTITATTSHTQREWAGFCIVYRNKTAETARRYFTPASNVQTKKDVVEVTATFPLTEIDFCTVFWNMYAVFTIDGYQYLVPVKIKKNDFYEMFCKLISRNVYKDNKGYILFPYRSRKGAIILAYRKWDKNDRFSVQLKERIALRIYKYFKKSYDAKKALLIYEKYGVSAQDNGYYLFKYCMEHQMEEKMGRKIYYVIDKHSQDYQKVKKYKKNVIDFLSLKYFLYMQACRVLLSPDIRNHAYIWHNQPSYMPDIIAEKKHVFLQHGVTALKIVPTTYDKLTPGSSDLFIVTSEMEKNIVSKFYHYPKEEVAVTGFARWDVLEDHSTDRKEIMVMPTWRNWLDDMTDEEFCQSDYYENYTALLNSERLKALLEKNDCYVNFYIHPKFREYIKNFDSKLDRVRLISFDEEPMNKLLMSCKLLITDYSSVSWDVFYQSKPVLFYQFDLPEYNQANGSFIDMEKDLFGDRAMELDGLLDLIEQSINNNFVLEEKYKAKLKDSFAYIDDQNSTRICEVLMEKGW